MTTPHPALRLVVAATCAVLLWSCGSDTPTAPSGTGPRSGLWVGTLLDAANVPGTLRLTIDEHPIDAARSLLSGTWSAAYQDASRNGAGTLAGTLTGTTGTLLFTPSSPPACASGPFASAVGSFTVPQFTIADPMIHGSYSQVTCDGTITGTLTLARQ